MHLFYLPNLASGILPADESRHAIKVLRLTTGDTFDITDGQGNLCKAEITDPNPRECAFKIVRQSSVPKKNFSIHLGIAPTKNADRMEWMVEKCVEIGVDSISFILCKTSERKTINLERIEKVAVSAMKQSQHYWLPKLHEITPFDHFIKRSKEECRFIAFVDDSNPNHLKTLSKPASDYLVVVGPEGDFSPQELNTAIKSGFQKVSLGPNRLRTETAGLAAVMILNLVNVP